MGFLYFNHIIYLTSMADEEYADQMIEIQKHCLYQLELTEYTAVGVELSRIESGITNLKSHDGVQELSSSIDRLKIRILDDDWENFKIHRGIQKDPLYSEWVRYCQRLGQATGRLSKAEYEIRQKATS